MYNRETMIQSCAGCIFQERDPDNKQTGCSFGRPLKFANTVNVYRDEDEGSFEFARYCNYYRNDEWYSNVGAFCGKTLNDVVKDESRVQYTTLIYIPDNTNLNTIQQTLNSLNEQTFKPRLIIIIDNSGQSREIAKLKFGAPKKINIVLERKKKAEYHYDINAKKAVGTYLVFMEAGYVLPKQFSECLEKTYNEDLKYLSMITSTEFLGCLVVQRTLFDALGGFTGEDPKKELPKGIIEKVEYVSKLENKSYHIVDMESFLNGDQ